MDWVFNIFDSPLGVAIVGVVVSIVSVVVRMLLSRAVGGLFGSVSRFALDKPIPAATLTSTPTNGTITLRQILAGQLGHPSTSAPAERIKVLEELHAQGGISADKLEKLKAAIAAGG